VLTHSVAIHGVCRSCGRRTASRRTARTSRTKEGVVVMNKRKEERDEARTLRAAAKRTH
jgi:hypothetical protein